MPNAKLNKWISFRLQQIGLECVGCFPLCLSLHQKRYLKNQSECNTLAKKGWRRRCVRELLLSSVSAPTPWLPVVVGLSCVNAAPAQTKPHRSQGCWNSPPCAVQHFWLLWSTNHPPWLLISGAAISIWASKVCGCGEGIAFSLGSYWDVLWSFGLRSWPCQGLAWGCFMRCTSKSR